MTAARYLIRCAHTGRLIAWSHDPARAMRCAEGLCACLIPVYLETSS